jgi:hypothetical protein
MEELAKQLGYNTAPFMYAAAAYGLFHWLDENASDEAKAALARTMSFKDYKKEQIASALVEVFDLIYTYPLLRSRAFFRSLLFTTAVSVVYVVEFVPFKGRAIDLFLPPFGQTKSEFDLGAFAISFVFWGWPLNVASDYLSLFVIRPLLIRSGTKPVIGLALGTVSGVAIVLAANVLRSVAMAVHHDWQDAIHNWQALILLNALPFAPPWDPGFFAMWALWSFPAIAVFVWLPLFAFGIVIARLLTPLSWIVGRTQWFLKEGKEHPLKAIGYVAAVVVFLGTVAGRIVFSA